MKNRHKIYAISYSDKNYNMSKRLNLVTAKIIGGADYIISFAPNDIDENFKEQHADIFNRSRGAGYWIWKPYIILKTLQIMKEGDYLIYTDAGLIYVNKISELIRQLNRDNQDIFLSYGFAPCKDWIKRDAFVLMDCDCEQAYNETMVSGGYVLIRKSSKSIKFIEKWLYYASDRRIITDDANECNLTNLHGFIEHRHDQGILSLLAWKEGIMPYKGVSLVDEPRMHRDVLKTHLPGAYRYTFNQRLEYMYYEHQKRGYQLSDYSRMFINTRIKDTGYLLFLKQLIVCIKTVKGNDNWGEKNDLKYLKKAQDRLERNLNLN